MKNLKNFAADNRRYIRGIVFHAFLGWAALALGYNSYKEVMQEFEPLTRAVKDSIKTIFPWAILTFSGLYFVFSVKSKNNSNFLTVRQYAYLIAIYSALINLFYFTRGKDIIISLNLSIPYLAILLLIYLRLSKVKAFESNDENLKKAQNWLPPIIYGFIMSNLPTARAYVKQKPSAPFIIAFMTLLGICAILLIFKAEKTAEQLANIAYFSLVIGVGIEIFQINKYGKYDERDDG